MQTFNQQAAFQSHCVCLETPINHTRMHENVDIVFDPIVEATTQDIFGYEAFVAKKQTHATTLTPLAMANQCAVDQTIRLTAIQQFHALGLEGVLNISLAPNARCVQQSKLLATLALSIHAHRPANKLLLAIKVNENTADLALLTPLFSLLKNHYYMTAINGFGVGYASLSLLNSLKPKFIKLDDTLISHIDSDQDQQSVVLSIIKLCKHLNIQLIATGVATPIQYQCLSQLGINLMQGAFFASMQQKTGKC